MAMWSVPVSRMAVFRGRHGRGAKELCIDWEFYGYIMTSIEQFLYITFWRIMVEGRKNGLGVWEWFSRRLKRRKMGGFWLSCSDSSSKKKFLEKNSFEHLIWPINNQWSFQNCCFCSLAAFFTRPKPENTLRQRGSELRDGANMAGMISIGKFMGNPLKMEVSMENSWEIP